MKLRRLARPFFIRRVSGRSMEPNLHQGSYVLVSSLLKPKVKKVVVIEHMGINKIKRIIEISGDNVIVAGDNLAYSTDSRNFGPIDINMIIGTVILPRL